MNTSVTHNGRVSFDEPMPEFADEAAIRAILKDATGAVSELLAGGGRPPATLSVRAGHIAIELTWLETPANAPSVIPASEAVPEPSDASFLNAPAVGVFYRAPSPGADPFVREGDTVHAGDQVGIIEVMKLLIPVEASSTGRIVRVLKSDGEAVEHDEPLFEMALL